MDLHLNLEIVCRKTDEKNCSLSWRFINTSDTPITEETSRFFADRLTMIMDELKAWCEK